jgi:UDP-glucose 4-epimerase
VRAAVRPGAPALPAELDRVEVAALDDAERWRAPSEGAALVVHAAGRAHVMRPSGDEQAAFDDVNVAGARAVVAAAARAGVRHVVLLSSIAALGAGSGAALSEAEEPRPADAYGRSKLAAERAARDAVGGTATRLSIVRPPWCTGRA